MLPIGRRRGAGDLALRLLPDHGAFRRRATRSCSRRLTGKDLVRLSCSSTNASSPAVKLGTGFGQALSSRWRVGDRRGAGDRALARPHRARRATPPEHSEAPLRRADPVPSRRPTSPRHLRRRRTSLRRLRPRRSTERAPRPLTPEGTICSAISSREAACAAGAADSPWLAYPLSGGTPSPDPRHRARRTGGRPVERRRSLGLRAGVEEAAATGLFA